MGKAFIAYVVILYMTFFMYSLVGLDLFTFHRHIQRINYLYVLLLGAFLHSFFFWNQIFRSSLALNPYKIDDPG